MFRHGSQMDDLAVKSDIRVFHVCREDLVHGPLKCRCGVTQPKLRNKELETSVFCLECRPLDMLWVDSDLVNYHAGGPAW